MSLKDDLAHVEDLCSRLLKTKASPNELYDAWKIREDIIKQIKSEARKTSTNQ